MLFLQEFYEPIIYLMKAETPKSHRTLTKTLL